MGCSCIIDLDIDEHGLEVVVDETRFYFPTQGEQMCTECGKQILIGEKYHYYEQIESYDNDYEICKSANCADCESVIDAFFCKSFLIGQVWECVKDSLEDTRGEVSTECLEQLTLKARGKIFDIIEEIWS